LDPRIGRWLSIDPKFQPWQSSYTSMDNNPIMYNDVLGDKVKGESNVSATRLVDEIKDSFSGEDMSQLRSLFKLDKDGVTLSPINEDAFTNAISNLNESQQQLAYGYKNAINSSNIHTVEMVYRSENLSSTGASISGQKTGNDIDNSAGGGLNISNSGNSTFSIIVMDSKAKVTDFRSGGLPTTRSSSPGELLSHELLGHGVGRLNGSVSAHFVDAIQMTNLYLRAQGINNIFRNGAAHGKKPGEIALLKSDATSVPSYIQLPSTLIMSISLTKLNAIIPLPIDNTYVSPKLYLR
jgi:hypothetical protein